MRLVRFQQKPGENRAGVMLDNTYLVELPAVKGSSEHILDFLKDPQAEEKAATATESGLKLVKNGRQNKNGPVHNID
ncbi:MAG TPA: hypothetical protein VIH83_00130, partial [Candidatus Bathyarchaeia archaeon]